jgi:peptidoglycan/LPS O-acetylase OafA/YrhL
MISYGIYLWHLGVLAQLDRWGFESLAHRNTVVWFAAAMAISVVLASASYYVVERPFLKLKPRVGGSPAPQSGESRLDPAPVTPASP